MQYILYFIIAILICAPVYLIVVMYRIRQTERRLAWLASQKFTTLRIDVPKNNDKMPLAAEQMFASIHGIYSESALYQSHLSFEIVAKDKFIQFYVHIPTHIKDFVEGQIYAQYPTVEINEVPDYTQETKAHDVNFAACEIGLNKPDVYPVRFFDSFEVDPLSGITSVMSKLNPGEEVWFQILIRPVGDNWQEKGNSIVSAVRAGKKPGGQGMAESFIAGSKKFLRVLFAQAINPGAEVADTGKAEVKLPASVEEALKGIEQKITKLGFESKIRILCIAKDPITASAKCQGVAASFKQFNTTNLNGFRVGEIHKNNFDAWQSFVNREFVEKGNVFNIAELASIYHLPNQTVATPNIVWSGSKKGEPPANLPLSENTPSVDLTVIGVTNFRNVYREFGIKRDDRRRHVYIIGKSGTGKSTLIENMAVDDVVEGRGVIIVDPHGELADKVISCVPDDRINDVIVFDPADRAYPIGFNLLETVEDDFKGMVASGFVGIFKKIFGDSWGPRLEHILRNTVLALLDFPDSTMLDIPRMLTDNRFRDRVVEKVQDPVIRDFWVNEFAQYDAKFRTEAVSPILNKVGQFLATATIRNIVGQANSRINIREIMDQEKILVVNLSRGKIGEDNSALLGAMMITKIQLAAMSRADVTADKRPDSFLYVDEFQNFATESFAVILSEARKYNLCLTMANQYVEQMTDEVKSAVFGNAGTLITFRVGGTDADFLVKEYEPVFDANDLVNLDKFQIYIKLLVNGISSPAFSAKTLPPVQKLTGNTERIINQSHEKYSSDRAYVEEQIAGRNRQEEDELKAEAEAYKQGGLEALLLRKGGTIVTPGQRPIQYSPKPNPAPSQPQNISQNSQAQSSAPIALRGEIDKKSEPDKPSQQETVQNFPPKVGESAAQETAGPAFYDAENNNEDRLVRKEKPRVFKYQNIIGDKIFKEQTARGGIRWYIGEDIDYEKNKELGIEMTPEALKMIELAKRVSNKSQDSSQNKIDTNEAKDKNSDGSGQNSQGGDAGQSASSDPTGHSADSTRSVQESSDRPLQQTNDQQEKTPEDRVAPANTTGDQEKIIAQPNDISSRENNTTSSPAEETHPSDIKMDNLEAAKDQATSISEPVKPEEQVVPYFGSYHYLGNHSNLAANQSGAADSGRKINPAIKIGHLKEGEEIQLGDE